MRNLINALNVNEELPAPNYRSQIQKAKELKDEKASKLLSEILSSMQREDNLSKLNRQEV